ncbi:hypothetical protein BSKO_01061 [Bryopsis sp. KO-2023]|nr:hypothetical protein BSKO_01061 [Bryopsis sp. KO-2023]
MLPAKPLGWCCWRCARLAKTPFLIAFWHMIPLPLVLWGLSLAGIVSLKSYSWMRLRSNLLVTLVHAIQVRLCFAVFVPCSGGVLQGVVFLITWICFSLILLEVAFDVQIFGKSMLRKQQLALMIGLAGFCKLFWLKAFSVVQASSRCIADMGGDVHVGVDNCSRRKVLTVAGRKRHFDSI